MRYAKFPFFCPDCGDRSTPLERGEGPQAVTVFFCNRCKNSPAASKPADPETPSIYTANHPAASTPTYRGLAGRSFTANHPAASTPTEGRQTIKCAHCSTQIKRYSGGHFSDLYQVTLCDPCLDKHYVEVNRKNSFWGKLFG